MAGIAVADGEPAGLPDAWDSASSSRRSGCCFSAGHAPSATTDINTRSVYPWIIVAIWVLCGIGALMTYLKVSTTKYVLTTERLRVTTGVLSTRTEDLELRRVRDSTDPAPVLGAPGRPRRRADPERRREHAAGGAARDT